MVNKLLNLIEQKRGGRNYFWRLSVLVKDFCWRWIKKVKQSGTTFYLKSFFFYLKNKNYFNDVDTYCIFIGHARSGSTLIHALFDAHPNIVISNELSFKGFFDLMLLNKNLVFSLILERNQEFVKKGKVGRAGHIYNVPGQWQGKFKKIKVIGDKDQRKATNKIYSNQKLIGRFGNRLKLKVKLIQVVRNPYDVISSHFLDIGGSLDEVVNNYFLLMDKVKVIKKLYPGYYFEVNYEALIKNPRLLLKDLCQFLTVEATAKYLNDCSVLVWSEPHRSRYEIKWPTGLIERIGGKIKDYDFLRHYSFDD